MKLAPFTEENWVEYCDWREARGEVALLTPDCMIFAQSSRGKLLGGAAIYNATHEVRWETCGADVMAVFEYLMAGAAGFATIINQTLFVATPEDPAAAGVLRSLGYEPILGGYHRFDPHKKVGPQDNPEPATQPTRHGEEAPPMDNIIIPERRRKVNPAIRRKR